MSPQDLYIARVRSNPHSVTLSGIPTKRTEHVPQDILKQYRECLNLVYPHTGPTQENDLLRYGSIFGISAMLGILDGFIQDQVVFSSGPHLNLDREDLKQSLGHLSYPP